MKPSSINTHSQVGGGSSFESDGDWDCEKAPQLTTSNFMDTKMQMAGKAEKTPSCARIAIGLDNTLI